MANGFFQDGNGDKSSTRLYILYILLFDTIIISLSMFWQKDIPTNAYYLLSTINAILLSFGLTKGGVENTNFLTNLLNKKEVKNDNDNIKPNTSI